MRLSHQPACNYPTDWKRRFLWFPAKFYRHLEGYERPEKIRLWWEWVEYRDPGPAYLYFEARLADGSEWRHNADFDV